jgi:hypothetical protein
MHQPQSFSFRIVAYFTGVSKYTAARCSAVQVANAAGRSDWDFLSAQTSHPSFEKEAANSKKKIPSYDLLVAAS